MKRQKWKRKNPMCFSHRLKWLSRRPHPRISTLLRSHSWSNPVFIFNFSIKAQVDCLMVYVPLLFFHRYSVTQYSYTRIQNDTLTRSKRPGGPAGSTRQTTSAFRYLMRELLYSSSSYSSSSFSILLTCFCKPHRQKRIWSHRFVTLKAKQASHLCA